MEKGFIGKGREKLCPMLLRGQVGAHKNQSWHRIECGACQEEWGDGTRSCIREKEERNQTQEVKTIFSCGFTAKEKGLVSVGENLIGECFVLFLLCL